MWPSTEEGLVYVDIETSALKPRDGIVFCTGALDDVARVVGGQGESERYVLLRTSSWLNKAKAIVTWSGSRFDIPFLNYRLAVHRLPRLKIQQHIDLQKFAPRQHNGHPASLEKECRRYGIEAKATPFNEAVWAAARQGNEEALASIAQHCREDIISLKELYQVMRKRE